MTKIVYNSCYGGFGLSHEAVMRYAEIKGITLYYSGKSFISYYLCPVAEYHCLKAEEKASLGDYNTGGPYARSNAMYFNPSEIDRDDPALVQVVEELGDKANGPYAHLFIEDVPAGTLYRIDEYDGNESVMTQDSYDWKVA